MIYFTHRRMSGGKEHEHIARLKWRDPNSGGIGDNSRAELVDFINKGGKAYVQDPKGDIPVGVVDANPPYLRTYADGKWTNNLLALPEY